MILHNWQASSYKISIKKIIRMRKYIHPNKQYKEAQNLNKHTCKMNKVFKYKKMIPTKNNLTLIQLIRWMNNKLF